MGQPLVGLAADHLRVRLRGTDALAAATRGFDVPYSTLRAVDVVPPEWPGLLEVWGLGLRAPPFVLRGSVSARPLGPFDRFVWQDHSTRRVLRLRLEGHARYREVHLDIDEAERFAEDLRTRS